ncbi:MAG: hypothetical protein ACRDLD_02185 [Thermoleophilaceae bacterium]
MSLYVPPQVAAELVEERQRHAADLRRHVEVRDALERFNAELRRIDPYLQLVKARLDTELPGLRPGYYHIIRHNPGAPSSIKVHEGRDGEFREPDSGLFRELAESDMWSDRARAQREKLKRTALDAERQAQAAEQAERISELHDRAKAAWSPGVRVSRSIG